MQLDIRTLILLLALGDVAAILIMLAYVRKAALEAATLFFLIGAALQAIAWTLLGLRGTLPDALSILAGNALIFAGFSFEALGFASVGGRNRAEEREYLLIVAIGLVLLLPFQAKANLRVAVASLVTVAIYARFALSLAGRARRSPLSGTIAIAAAAYALALGARALIAAMQSSFTLFSTHFVQYLAMLPQYLMLILGTVGFILLLKERDDELLRESEEKYRLVTERANEAIVIIQDGKYVFANRRAAEMVGRANPSEMIDKEMGSKIHGEDQERVRERVLARLAGKEVPAGCDFRILGPDGTPFWVSSSSSLITYKGRPANLAVISDIDERKRQQESIEKLLAEKELLLREVNHRVKNNLGVAISLLSLHAGAAAGRPAEDVLAEAGSMLATMSELYESLHRAGSSGTLSIRDYLPSLVDEVSRLFPMEPPIRFGLDLADIRLDARLLSPLGIILNEIMTNSLRHGFEGIAVPTIYIGAGLSGGIVSIVCSDNGKGFPPGFDPAKSTGFGATLILALARQLGATWKVGSGRGRHEEGADGPGASWSFEFPIEETSGSHR